MKIEIKAKNKKDKVKAWLLEKEFKKWFKELDGSEMFNEYMQLANSIILFRAKWGIPVELVIGELEYSKGRKLGKGIAEKLFNSPSKYTPRGEVK